MSEGDLEQRSRVGFRRFTLRLAVLLISVNLVIGLPGLIAVGDRGAWGTAALAVGILLASNAFAVGVFLLLRRVSGPRSFLRSPAWAATRGDARRIPRAIRSGEHLEGDDEVIALDIARRQLRQRVLVPVIAVAAVMTGAALVRFGTLSEGIALIVFGLLSGVWSARHRRDGSQARHYLATVSE